jgi:hypothetical protein
MTMSFSPMSEDELNESGLAPKGEYGFDVLTAKDKISKSSGSPMIEVKIGLYRNGTVANHVYDYLLPSIPHKLRHFCDSVGLLKQYQSGTLCAADCEGRSGTAKIDIEPAGNYPAKNVVKDYVLRAAKPLAGTTKANDEGLDDLQF